jgi:hypothetical protein
MLSITHIVVSLLLIQILNLDRNDAFVALVFGVFIDLDHLFGLKDYTKANGFRSLMDFHTLVNPGGHWKSMMHNPVALAVVGPLSVASKLAIPLVFWGVHISMDFIQESFLGEFSQAEAMLLVFSGFALVTLRYSKFVESGYCGGIIELFKKEWSDAKRLAYGSV